MVKPSKEQVRAWLQARVRNREPLPPMDAIRRSLYGNSAGIERHAGFDCSATLSAHRDKLRSKKMV